MSVVLIFLSIFIYYINLLMSPAVITASDVETRAKVTEIINSVILNEYLAQFNYDNVVHVEKDKDGNIVMIKADTLKMNKIACDVALESQNQLKNIGEVGLKLPLGYILKNNLLAFFGPDITVKMKPVGYIETKYLSDFESAGINQTRHKIYVQVKTRMKIIIPFNSKDIEVKNEVPISETIIVGKVPETAINLGLDNAGYTLPNGK
ncbi:sporulation protein YunB [Clostridium sp. DJ247]|nr:sporulation protein YunB [Clostridium sp. DJ247]